MLSIIEDVEVKGVYSSLLPHQVDENNNECQRRYLKRTSEIEASTFTTKNSQQKSNLQVIPNNLKQTSSKHNSKKIIKRLIDEIFVI